MGYVLSEMARKVYLDRYALKDDKGNPIEDQPEQMWNRVATAVAEYEDFDSVNYWHDKFYGILEGFKFVPGGRILAGAGTDTQVTYYNCFQGDTLVHTIEGAFPIKTLKGNHLVRSEGGFYRPAEFKSFGIQELYKVTLENGDEILTTAGHEWVTPTNTKGKWLRVKTTDLVGKTIPVNPSSKPVENTEDFYEGARHGIVFGDGSSQYNKTHVCLFGDSQELSWLFEGYPTKKVSYANYPEHTRVSGLPISFKQLPSSESSSDYLRGFISGLISADGHVDKRGVVMVHNKSQHVLEEVANFAIRCSIVANKVTLSRSTSPYDGSDKPLYKLSFFRSSLSDTDILREGQKERFRSVSSRTGVVKVVSVEAVGRSEEVYCCVEPQTHTMTVGRGYLTGNCFVLPEPEDSRRGIMENITDMIDIMSRGGGVGVNLSSLRPKGAYIKTVNGHSSGPVPWMELYSDACGKVIQQGGSRRGALMLMLDDHHPDIREFVTRKSEFIIDGKYQTPKYLQHANISVAISDDFMEAVLHDADWHLYWEGDGKRIDGDTIKARDLWNLIVESAWKSADPGLVFMERYRKESNSHYFEDIRCVNPCAEQGLGPWSVCLLGAFNLSAYVRDGVFDFDDFSKDAYVAVRFLDNVIDLNHYFMPQNEQAQKHDIRRMGIGTMGLADALIKLKLRYGSDQAIDFSETIFRVLRDAAYQASVSLAKERGSFGKFDSEQYLKGKFIQTLPEWIQVDIAEYGIRNCFLLTNAPTGSTSLLSDTSSGIEPVFDFAMTRRDRIGEHTIYHPLLEEWQNTHDPSEPTPDYFVNAENVTPEEHIKMQAACQRYIDSSISKTINLPSTATVDDVKRIYELAYAMGCKGITVYRDGSRDAVLSHMEEKPQPAKIIDHYNTLSGETSRVTTPVGSAHVTINRNGDPSIAEVFVTVGKAGSEIQAHSEAIGRLISLIFRIPTTVPYEDVANEVVHQLEGIGGSESVGMGKKRVKSLPDGVAKVIKAYLAKEKLEEEDAPKKHRLLDLCSECGQASMVYEEGCSKCMSCGFAKC